MVVIVYGTTGELIKMAPLIKSLQKQKADFITLNLNWQPVKVAGLIKQAGLPKSTLEVANGYKGKDITKTWQSALWFFSVIKDFIKLNKKFKEINKESNGKLIFLVHGDATPAPIAAFWWGKLHNYKIGHIEAGLRSHDLRNPFPEELNRRAVARYADLHFAPGDAPAKDLKKEHRKGKIINTKVNTIHDAIAMAKDSKTKINLKLPKKYGLVSIHRNELMSRPEELKKIMVFMDEYSQKTGKELVFVDHPFTLETMARFGYDKLMTSKHVTHIPKQDYFAFVKVLSGADFVVTDSGGLQEECAFLNMPCLIYRLATERTDGLGRNVVMAKYDLDVVEEFLQNPDKYRSKTAPKIESPTKVIEKTLRDQHYV